MEPAETGRRPHPSILLLRRKLSAVGRFSLYALNRFNRYSITLPGVLGTHGLQVRVFQYWSGVGRGAMAGI